MPKIVLASGSKYRIRALYGLGLAFDTFSPNVDETPHSRESPEHLSLRLAQEKCLAGAREFGNCYIIGGDQVGSVNSRMLSKPGDFDNALQQLLACQGQTATFYTALAFYEPHQSNIESTVVTTELTFRNLSESQLSRYLLLDEPYDCAGGFKIESGGSVLFSEIRSADPFALVGLPLIALTGYLISADIL